MGPGSDLCDTHACLEGAAVGPGSDLCDTHACLERAGVEGGVLQGSHAGCTPRGGSPPLTSFGVVRSLLCCHPGGTPY